jgi:hypothetical protein
MKIKKINLKKISPKTIRRAGLVAIVIAVLAFLWTQKSFFLSARVNRHFITRLQVLSALEKQGYAKEIIDSLITEKLILDEAGKKKVAVSDQEVATEVATIEEKLKAQGTSLESALTMQGQTKADLEKNLKIRLLINKLLADKVSLTDEEIKKYFDDNKNLTYKGKKLEEVKDEIKATLSDQKLYDEFQKWLTEIKATATIVNY